MGFEGVENNPDTSSFKCIFLRYLWVEVGAHDAMCVDAYRLVDAQAAVVRPADKQENKLRTVLATVFTDGECSQ